MKTSHAQPETHTPQNNFKLTTHFQNTRTSWKIEMAAFLSSSLPPHNSKRKIEETSPSHSCVLTQKHSYLLVLCLTLFSLLIHDLISNLFRDPLTAPFLFIQLIFFYFYFLHICIFYIIEAQGLHLNCCCIFLLLIG